MSKEDELRYGPVGAEAIHLSVDMQRMFAEDTEWKMPWLPRVLPNVVAITATHPERTVFTRFFPARAPGHGVGMWRRYYERWSSMTIDELGGDMVDLVPSLASFAPPARTSTSTCIRRGPVATCTRSCQARASTLWSSRATRRTSACWPPCWARSTGASRVVLVTDAICGSADETHDSMMTIYMNPFPAGGVRDDGNPPRQLARRHPCERSAMTGSYLVQILLPKETGQGEKIPKDWFDSLVKEMTDKFGGATSFVRSPGEGLWRGDGGTERDNIAVIEVMTERLVPEYWRALRERLETELAQKEIVIRAQEIIPL
ncbi:nicotinamidase-related amidase [Bradyrhizobium japonicum]